MVDMRMREQNVTNRQPAALGERQQAFHLVAGVDEHRFVRFVASDDEAVLENGPTA
jgi:hypothetical protein